MKKTCYLLFLVCTIVCCLLSSGCQQEVFPQPEIVPPFPHLTGDNLIVDVKILHEKEIHTRLFPAGRAELYLKVYDQSDSGAYLLYPLNVGDNDSGSRTRNIKLPYTLKSEETTLVFEVLDDDEPSKEEKELLTTASERGAGLLYVAGSIYALTGGSRKSAEEYEEIRKIIQENKDDAAELGKVSAKLLIKTLNQHRFKSYGSIKFVLCSNSQFGVPFRIKHPEKNIDVLELMVIRTDK